MAADQLELFSIINPCIGVCESNARGYCKGCLRSRQERFGWHQKSAQEQRHIINLITRRRQRIKQHLQQQAISVKDIEHLNEHVQASLFDDDTPFP